MRHPSTPASTPAQGVTWVSTLLAHEGTYGLITAVSRVSGVSRPTLYAWREQARAVLAALWAASPAAAGDGEAARARGDATAQAVRGRRIAVRGEPPIALPLLPGMLPKLPALPVEDEVKERPDRHDIIATRVNGNLQAGEPLPAPATEHERQRCIHASGDHCLPPGSRPAALGRRRSRPTLCPFCVRFRAHNLAITTISIKNLQGIVVPLEEHQMCTLFPRCPGDRGGQDLRSFVLDSHERWAPKICDISLARRPDLNLVDAVFSRDGTGFRQGTNRPLGFVLAGINQAAVDTIGTALMGSIQRSSPTCAARASAAWGRLGSATSACARSATEP